MNRHNENKFLKHGDSTFRIKSPFGTLCKLKNVKYTQPAKPTNKLRNTIPPIIKLLFKIKHPILIHFNIKRSCIGYKIGVNIKHVRDSEKAQIC